MPDTNKKDRLRRQAQRRASEKLRSLKGGGQQQDGMNAEQFFLVGVEEFGGFRNVWKLLRKEWDAAKVGSNSRTVISRMFAQLAMHMTQYNKSNGIGSEQVSDEDLDVIIEEEADKMREEAEIDLEEMGEEALAEEQAEVASEQADPEFEPEPEPEQPATPAEEPPEDLQEGEDEDEDEESDDDWIG